MRRQFWGCLWGWVVRFSVRGTLGGHGVILSVERCVNESKEARMCGERVGKRAERQGLRVCASKQWETMLDPGREHLDCPVTTLA